MASDIGNLPTRPEERNAGSGAGQVEDFIWVTLSGCAGITPRSFPLRTVRAMALAHQDVPRLTTGTLSRSIEPRRHGQSLLAEVVPIRSVSPRRVTALGSMMTRIAQVFASLR